MLQRDPCIFWRCSVRMFCRYCCNWSIHALFAIMEYHSMTQSCSTFAIKYFWQILNMICNFAKLIVVDPYILGMLVFSCIALWWVHQAHKEAIILLFLPCSVFCKVWNLITKLAMFTCLPSYLLVLFGLWSVRDICYMLWVDSCHAFVCYDLFL